MTVVLDAPPRPVAAEDPAGDSAPRPLGARWVRAWLGVILAVQVTLALRPGPNTNASDDEGLYLSFGHQMLGHTLHGTPVVGFPASYFSGAPSVYPLLAAVGDSLGGLAGARAVSLVFALIATVATFGLGRQLFGSRAGLIGAAALVLNGSIIFESHLATYDSMALCLVALAAWLSVHAVQRDRSVYLPVSALLLAVAFFTDYAMVIYLPAIAVLAIAVGWRAHPARAVKRAGFLLAATVILIVWAIDAWGRALLPGIRQAILDRTGGGLGAATVTRDLLAWVGPWLVLALVTAVLRRDQWRLTGVLLLTSVVGPLEEIRLGHTGALQEQVAFGLVFACPLIGDLLGRLTTRNRRVGAVLLTVMMANFAVLGLHYSGRFASSWPDDQALLPTLSRDITASRGMPILGEESDPQRYELRDIASPSQWNDTYYLGAKGTAARSAYLAAIDERYFGVIYLDLMTPTGRFVNAYLQYHRTPYQLQGVANRVIDGQAAGAWILYTPVAGGPPLS